MSKDTTKPGKSKNKEDLNICCVKNCDAFFKGQNRFFFKFPAKEEMRKKWLDILKIQVLDFNKVRICEKHFIEYTDYPVYQWTDVRRLRQVAVPSLNLEFCVDNNSALIKTELEFDSYEMQENNLENQSSTSYQDEFLAIINNQNQHQVDIKVPLIKDNQSEDSNICRICLRTENSMVWLFDQHELEKSVAGLYTYCTGLEVADDNKLPQYICKNCFDRLEDACKLKKTSIDSHFILKGRLESKNDQEQAKPTTYNVIEDPLEVENNKNQESLKQAKDQLPKKYKYGKRIRHPRPFFCEICEARILTGKRKHLRMHKEVDKEQEQKMLKFFCQICKTKVLLTDKTEHLEMHEQQKLKQQCGYCSRKFLKESDLANHVCIYPPIKTCDSCQINFELTKEFKNHLLDVHFVDDVYTCGEPDCGEKIKTPFNKAKIKLAYSHVKSHKYKYSRQCETCGETFKDATRFAVHRHPKKRIYTCDYCGVVMSEKSNLEKHIKTRHLNVKYYCDQCPASYTDKMVLKFHQIREHGKEAPFKCNNCTHRFLFQSQLKIHQKTLCGREKERKHESKVNKYFLMLGPRHFKCNECSKSFSHRANIVRHYKIIHLNIRSFVCDICNKKFGQKREVVTHMLKVHKD